MINYLWAGNGKIWSFYSLPFPSSYSYSNFHSHETSLAIPILIGIQRDQQDPWEFPMYAHL